MQGETGGEKTADPRTVGSTVLVVTELFEDEDDAEFADFLRPGESVDRVKGEPFLGANMPVELLDAEDVVSERCAC